MQVQTTVIIDRDWQNRFEKDDEVFTQLVAFHIAIDPITQQKSVTVYTDDGRGNGLPILMFDM